MEPTMALAGNVSRVGCAVADRALDSCDRPWMGGNGTPLSGGIARLTVCGRHVWNARLNMIFPGRSCTAGLGAAGVGTSGATVGTSLSGVPAELDGGSL